MAEFKLIETPSMHREFPEITEKMVVNSWSYQQAAHASRRCELGRLESAEALNAVTVPIKFAPIPSPRAFEQICVHIRADIASGVLKPGDKLPAEREMAVQFGVSRGAIREALRSLENAGLVVIGRGGFGGAVISDGATELITQSLQDLVHLGRISLIELTELRSILLTQAIQLACQRGLDEDFDRLEQNILMTESLLEGAQYEERRKAAIDFYRILTEGAKNVALSVLLESVNMILRQFLAAASRDTTRNLIGFRRNMLGCLRSRDKVRATAEMQKYLSAFHRHLTESLAAIGTTASPGATAVSASAIAKEPQRRLIAKSAARAAASSSRKKP